MIVVGGVGLFLGVIDDEAVPATEVPTSLVAVVLKVYAPLQLLPQDLMLWLNLLEHPELWQE